MPALDRPELDRPELDRPELELDLDRPELELERPGARSRRPRVLERADHGSVAAYGAGCRCRPCRDARRQYDRAWRGARQVLRTGELRRLVDPAPAAAHLAALLAEGWRVQDVADAVPCAHCTLDRILSSARRGRGRCWSTIQDRLAELAVEGGRP